MKEIIIFSVGLFGFIVGIYCLYYGANKNVNEKSNFNAFAFIKKGFKNTDFDEFTGKEIIALGVFSIIGSILLIVIYKWP